MQTLVSCDRSLPWLDHIEGSRALVPLKYVVRINAESLPESTCPELLIKYIDIGSVDSTGKISRTEEFNFEDSPSRARRIVKQGDTIVSTVRTYLKAIAYVDKDETMLVASTGFAVLDAMRSILYPRYLYYWMRSGFVIDEICARSTGVSYPATNASEIGAISIPTISIKQQKAIAHFLDRKTAAIATLIAKKQRLIQLLEEKRTALINQSVTKGLNSDAPMKDSGVPWIGEIPKHWEIKKLKWICPYILVGIVVTPAKYYVELGIPCLRSLNIRPNEIVEDKLVYISKESNELLSKSKIFTGDLVCVRTGQPGTTAVVDERFNGTNCIDLIIVRKPRHAAPDYISLMMNSEVCRSQYSMGTSGSIQQHFNVETATKLIVCHPPIEEQLRIIECCHQVTKAYTLLIQKASDQIEKLQEYRRSLITAAVTGKLTIEENAA